MFRRFLVSFARRAFVCLLLICLGCSAQSAPSDLTRAIEKHVRATYSVPSDVKVIIGPLRPSEFPNYDALTITFDNGEKKQDYEFVLAKDRKTMFRMSKIDLTRDPYAEAMKKIDVNGRPTRGNKSAKVVVINYDDFQCPFCSRMHDTLFPALFSEYGDRVLFIYKDYPLEEIHPWAVHAAVDANCLASQNNDAYWDFADYVHGNKKEVAGKSRQESFANLDRLAKEQGQKHQLDAQKLDDCIQKQDESAI